MSKAKKGFDYFDLVSQDQKTIIHIQRIVDAIALLALQFGIKYNRVDYSWSHAFARAAITDIQRKKGKSTPSLRDIADRSGTYPSLAAKILNGEQKTKTRLIGLPFLSHTWRFKPPYGVNGQANTLKVKSSVGKDFRSLCYETLPDRGYKNILRELVDANSVTIDEDKVTLASPSVMYSKRHLDVLEYCSKATTNMINVLVENINSSDEDHHDGLPRVQHFEQSYWNDRNFLNTQQVLAELVELFTETNKKAAEIIDRNEDDTEFAEIELRRQINAHLLIYTSPQLNTEEE